jgi:hypothetical protein
LHVWAFVLGHGGNEIVDDFVWHKGMSEVELCDVWLMECEQWTGEEGLWNRKR